MEGGIQGKEQRERGLITKGGLTAWVGGQRDWGRVGNMGRDKQD